MNSNAFTKDIGSKIRWLSRLGFLGLFLFELANYFGILKYSLDYTWFGLLITAFGALVGIEGAAYLLRRKTGVEMPWIIWLLGFGGVLFDVVGDTFHLYERIVWFDQLAHFLGTFLVTIFFQIFFRTMQRVKGWNYPPFVNWLLALGMGMTLGVLYEIEEYLEDMIGTANRLGDGEDTANDLLLNFLGATSVIGIAWVKRTFFRKRS
ncbi:hypothetical protein M0Q28_02940 [Patescibacteria group bacterium]|jgi:hypothetical protein|nr:hypothetical protein [Patescibacteria group bacterium]